MREFSGYGTIPGQRLNAFNLRPHSTQLWTTSTWIEILLITVNVSKSRDESEDRKGALLSKLV